MPDKTIIIRDKDGSYTDKVDIIIKVDKKLPEEVKTLSGLIRHLIDQAYKKIVK